VVHRDVDRSSGGGTAGHESAPDLASQQIPGAPTSESRLTAEIELKGASAPPPPTHGDGR